MLKTIEYYGTVISVIQIVCWVFSGHILDWWHKYKLSTTISYILCFVGIIFFAMTLSNLIFLIYFSSSFLSFSLGNYCLFVLKFALKIYCLFHYLRRLILRLFKLGEDQLLFLFVCNFSPLEKHFAWIHTFSCSWRFLMNKPIIKLTIVSMGKY